MGERRATPRWSAAGPHGILRVRVRPGHDASLVDICRHGAAVETACRLLPGSSVDLQLETERGRTSVRGRVLRCAVVAVQASRLTYRGAIRFDEPLRSLINPRTRMVSVDAFEGT